MSKILTVKDGKTEEPIDRQDWIETYGNLYEKKTFGTFVLKVLFFCDRSV